jgi:hypothetical protein
VELHDRGKALEEQFFQKEEAKKIAARKEQREKDERKEELKTASGMDDDAVLERLVEIGISAKTIAAVSLVPLVEVAWADGSMDAREREAILHGAKGKGIEEDSEAYQLLNAWLDKKPGTELFEAWSSYIGALDQELTAGQLEILKRQVIDRARGIAESAGGFLFGTFGRISEEEKKAIERLEAVFDRRAADRE